MFAYFRRRKNAQILAKALAVFEKEEPYEISVDNIETLYNAVAVNLVLAQDDISIRRNLIEFYREPQDLLDVLQAVNHALLTEGEVEINYNIHQALRREQIDNWLLTADKRRRLYYDFIQQLSEGVMRHIFALRLAEQKMNKVYHQTLLRSLYTVHCDILSVAEVHLRHYSQR